MKKHIGSRTGTLRATSLLALGVAWLVGAWASSAQEPAPPPAGAITNAPAAKPAESGTIDYTNWIEFSVGNYFVTGRKGSFQQQQQAPAGAFGGVEDFHWEQPLGKKGTFTLDGRAIFDNHDYLLRMQAREPDLGYVDAGYREFRTWYNGSGGFFPLNDLWLPVIRDTLAVDRGEAWFEAGLRRPNQPALTFRYTHDFRDGDKDSTIWGDSGLTGLPRPNNIRSIVPTLVNLDEVRDTFQFDLRHTVSRTDFGIGLRYELWTDADARVMHRRPGEPADRFVRDREATDADLFNVHAFVENHLNEKTLVTAGYAFTSLDTDVTGSRIYGSSTEPVFDPTFPNGQPFDEGFLGLDGGSRLYQHMANLNLMFNPWDDFAVIPALRIEALDRAGTTSFTETAVPATGGAATTEDLVAHDSRRFLEVTEALEARYTGITNWAFYARGEWAEGQGDLFEREHPTALDEPLTILRNTDDDRFTQKYTVGANWYPLRRLNLGAQYYHKERDNDYTHTQDSTTNAPPRGDRYPAFLTDQDFTADDVNFRITLRPWARVTSVTRYDFQLATIDTQAAFLNEIQTAEATRHIISESLTWSPLARWFLQASFSYSLDEIATPADNLTGAAQKLVLPARNDYWTLSALSGYALDDKTDLQVQYFYYSADNFQDNSRFSQPYGAEGQEHAVTAALIRQITRSLRLTLKYGFFNYHDVTFGGHNSYHAHLIYSALQYRF